MGSISIIIIIIKERPFFTIEIWKIADEIIDTACEKVHLTFKLF